MFVFLLQAAFLLAIAFVLGAVAGCLLRTRFNEKPAPASAREPAARTEQESAAPATSSVSEAADLAPAAEKTKPAPPQGESSAAAKSGKKPAAAKKTARTAARSAPAKTSPAPARKKAAGPSEADDLKRIKGVGRQIESKLNAAGITRYEQIAKWTKKDVAEFGEKLSFAGRIEREGWVAQAKKLAKGEMTDFAKRVAKGEVASSKTASRRKTGGKG